MTRRRLAFAALLLVACSGSSETRSQVSQSGALILSWTPVPAPLPFNQLFDLDVSWIGSDGSPADASTTLQIDAQMPAHGHGMQTTPQVTITGPGQATVKGMKFHMEGIWELRFTLQTATGQDLVTFTEAVP